MARTHVRSSRTTAPPSGMPYLIRWGNSALLENCIASTSILFSKLQKPTVDALAPEADEGRGWLRKATGSCLPSIDPWMSEWGNPPSRKTAVLRPEYIGPVEGTRGIETSQYPEEKKATATP